MAVPASELITGSAAPAAWSVTRDAPPLDDALLPPPPATSPTAANNATTATSASGTAITNLSLRDMASSSVGRAPAAGWTVLAVRRGGEEKGSRRLR